MLGDVCNCSNRRVSETLSEQVRVSDGRGVLVQKPKYKGIDSEGQCVAKHFGKVVISGKVVVRYTDGGVFGRCIGSVAVVGLELGHTD